MESWNFFSRVSCGSGRATPRVGHICQDHMRWRHTDTHTVTNAQEHTQSQKKAAHTPRTESHIQTYCSPSNFPSIHKHIQTNIHTDQWYHKVKDNPLARGIHSQRINWANWENTLCSEFGRSAEGRLFSLQLINR